MTHNTDEKNMPKYMFLDEGVFKLRLSAKRTGTKGNRINGKRISLRTSDFTEAKFIRDNLLQKYSIEDLNGFVNERLREIIESLKTEYIENRKSKILTFALRLNDLSIDYETALGFYRDSLQTDNVDQRTCCEKNLGLQIEKIIQETKWLDNALYLFNGKGLNDTNNIEYLSDISTQFRNYHTSYISMKNAFDVACLRDPALKVYQDRINEELKLNRSDKEANVVIPENSGTETSLSPDVQALHSLEYYIETYVKPKVEKLASNKDIINRIYKMFKQIGISENSDIYLEQSYNYANKILMNLEKCETTQSITTNKHYKSSIKHFFEAIRYQCGRDNEYYISKALDCIKQTKISGLDSIPYTSFTDEQLKAIFNKDEQFFKDNSSSFWTCAEALFCGSRANMSRTLLYGDIIQKEGVYCIKFAENHPEKHAKNKASQRIVPIHPQLLDLGFVDFIQKQKEFLGKQDKDPIFEDMFHPNGDYKTDMTTFLSENLFEKIGIKTQIDNDDILNSKRYGFHSFRKKANQTMESAGLKATEINCLIGWQGDGSTSQKNYGNRTLEDLIKANQKFSYNYLKEEFAYWKEYWASYFKDK